MHKIKKGCIIHQLIDHCVFLVCILFNQVIFIIHWSVLGDKSEGLEYDIATLFCVSLHQYGSFGCFVDCFGAFFVEWLATPTLFSSVFSALQVVGMAFAI